MRSDARKDSYTLLADDNVAIAVSPELRKNFKAHIVLSVLTNSSLMFSDNQIINALNLRSLLRQDETVRGLTSDHILHFALRQGSADHDGPKGQRLSATCEAFRRENKLRDSPLNDEPSEFSFVESVGKIVDWPYRAVRENYTSSCKRTLFSPLTRQLLGDQGYQMIVEAVAEEESASESVDQGLGRAFLQSRLPDELTKRGVVLTPEIRRHLLNCIEAPYLSGLPSVLRRNPIYEPQHAPSFELMRGQSFEFTDVEKPITIPTKLDAQHFIEGLTRLSLDDVHRLRDRVEFKKYLALSSRGVERLADLHELREAFEALNVRIDDSILGRFPELGRTNTPTPREIRTRVAVLSKGSSAFLDLLGLAVQIPGLGTGLQHVIDAISRREGLDEEAQAVREAAQRRLYKKDLRQHLSERGLAQTVEAHEEIVLTDSHASETLVVA